VAVGLDADAVGVVAPGLQLVHDNANVAVLRVVDHVDAGPAHARGVDRPGRDRDVPAHADGVDPPAVQAAGADRAGVYRDVAVCGRINPPGVVAADLDLADVDARRAALDGVNRDDPVRREAQGHHRAGGHCDVAGGRRDATLDAEDVD